MKHIKRKFFSAKKLDFDRNQIPDSEPVDLSEVNNIDESIGYMLTEENYLIQAFPYSGFGSVFFVPEPHPVVLYFNGAQNFIKYISESRAKFFEAVGNDNIQKTLDTIYTFFSNITIGTTFLCNALEASINALIPKDYEYKRKKRQSTEVFNQYQIQRELSFEEKIKIVIPEITGRFFHVENGHLYDSIIKLKFCRDEIAHTKSYSTGQPTPYKEIFTMALNFNYENAIVATAAYINFYNPGLIEECGCNSSH